MKKHGHDRDAYTDAKKEFVRRWTQEAKSNTGTDTDQLPVICVLCINLHVRLHIYLQKQFAK